MLKPLQPKPLYLLIPAAGIIIFIISYIVAAFLYPGGSDANHTARGFSWTHNYWCNLMADQAINGEPNAAKPVAIFAMVDLCITLIIFWYQVPLFFHKSRINKLIRICGIASMLCPPFLFTGYHDTVINLAASFGCLAMLLLLNRLYTYRMRSLLFQGFICILLVIINNYFYYSSRLIYLLAIVQKITFLFFLLWFFQLSVQLYRKQSTLARLSKVSTQNAATS